MKIIHVFQPDVTTRFGGQVIIWKSLFGLWRDNCTEHFILDYRTGTLNPASKFFAFSYPKRQIQAGKFIRLFAIFKLVFFLLKHRKEYDIVHLHIVIWAGLISGWILRKLRKPVIYESVLLDSDTPGGMVKTWLGHLKLYMLKDFSGIITISKALEEDYKLFGFDSSRLYTLMNPVDCALFQKSYDREDKLALRSKLGLSASNFVILFVGSFKERKGVNFLIDAFIQIRKSNSDMRLVIVGPDKVEDNPSVDVHFVENMRQRIRDGLVEKDVVITGLIDDKEELSMYYKMADVFAFPSLMEGLGNVVLEALSCSLPVVATELPVLKDIIIHGYNGYYVSPKNSQEMANALITIYDDIRFAENIGANARTTVTQNHSVAQWEQGLIRVYKGVMEKR